MRRALREPGLSLVIVLTLAIGIGANKAIFTLLSELYQPDVRAPDSDRLFRPGVITMAIHVPVVYYDDIGPQAALSDREARPFSCLLRLGRGVTREAVEARLTAVGRNLDREHPWPDGKKRHLSLAATLSSNTPASGYGHKVALVCPSSPAKRSTLIA